MFEVYNICQGFIILFLFKIRFFFNSFLMSTGPIMRYPDYLENYMTEHSSFSIVKYINHSGCIYGMVYAVFVIYVKVKRV